MVELLEQWTDLMDYSQYCKIIAYRVDRADGGFRVRVRAGNMGFDKVLNREGAKSILAWLKSNGAIKIVRSISDDLFFA